MSINPPKKKNNSRKGKKTEKTLEKERVAAAMRQKIMSVAEELVNTQLHLARGQSFLYKVEKKWVSTGKDRGWWRREKPELVEDAGEIKEYLERTITDDEDIEDEDSGKTYYYITTKSPDGSVIESMLNRTFGRAPQDNKVSGAIEIGILLAEAEKNR